jgi:hypothetical protein
MGIEEVSSGKPTNKPTQKMEHRAYEMLDRIT